MKFNVQNLIVAKLDHQKLFETISNAVGTSRVMLPKYNKTSVVSVFKGYGVVFALKSEKTWQKNENLFVKNIPRKLRYKGTSFRYKVKKYAKSNKRINQTESFKAIWIKI